jgi:hypothetical protein
MDPTLLGLMPETTGQVDQSSAWPIAGSTGVVQGTGAGQHGIAPLFVNGGTMGDAFNSVWGWLNEPFTSKLSPVGIFALIGTILVAMLLWNLILYHMRIAAEAI